MHNASMANEDSLKAKLSGLAEQYSEEWQRLPESLRLPEPLSVKSVLRVYRSGREQEDLRQDFDTPQAAIQAVLERGGRVVLVEGGPGQGKTSALRWAAHLACRDWPGGWGAEDPVPWFQHLGRLPVTGDGERTLEGILRGRLKVMRELRGLFFLDGLDLLTSKDPEPGALVAAALRSAEDDGHFFVFSGRPLPSVHAALRDGGLSYRIELAGLDQAAVDDWLEQHPGLRTGVDQICQANDAAADLRQTPLLFAMVISAAYATAGGQEPLVCDRHPGRAGLFAGFISHFLNRAVRQGRLEQRYTYRGRVLEGLCWAALMAGQTEEIPDLEDQNLLARVLAMPGQAGGAGALDTAEDRAHQCVQALRRAGIILDGEPDGPVRFIHQEFMEHLGGRHLARRLMAAMQGGWLDAELWDHLDYRRLDSLVEHSLAQTENSVRQATMIRAFDLLTASDLKQSVAPLAAVDSDIVADCYAPFLTSKDSRVRSTVTKALGRLNSHRSAELMIRKLDDESAGVRYDAVMGLGHIRDVQAVQPLLKILESPVAQLRDLASWALGHIQAPGAVEPLIRLLKHRQAGKRRIAARTLFYMKASQAVPDLIEALQDSFDSVRSPVVKALGAIKDPHSVGPLMEMLKDRNAGVRDDAVLALGALRDYLSTEPLMKTLKGNDDKARWAAAHLLVKIKTPETAAQLIDELHSSDCKVRRVAAWSLRVIQSPRAVKYLIEALNDQDGEVCKLAAEALGAHGDSSAVDPLMQVLKDTSADSVLRINAATALESLRADEAANDLLGILLNEDETPDLRQCIARVLVSLDCSSIVKHLITVFNDGKTDGIVRRHLAWILAALKANEAEDSFVSMRKDKDYQLRRVILEGLVSMNSPQVADFMIEALDDDDVWIRRFAAAELGEIKDPRAIGPLLDTLRMSSQHDPLDPITQAVFQALRTIGDSRAEGPLIALIREKGYPFRVLVAETLGAIGGDRSIEALKEALQDEEYGMRRTAAKAVSDIMARSSIDPFAELMAVEYRIDDEVATWIANDMGRRWPGRDNLEAIEAQRQLRKNAEEAMSKGGDTYNTYAPNAKQVVVHPKGSTITYNDNSFDPAPLLQALADLRREIQQPGAVQGADNAAILANMEEMRQAVHDKAEPEKVKGLWVKVERAIMVGTLTGQVMQLVQGIAAMLG